MKTHNNLYKEICSMENLHLAYKKARRGKSKNKSIIEFEKNLELELRKLHFELSTFTYKPLSLKKFIIRDPKTRVIHASAFRDRVVHHALINILSPIYEKIFIFDSYASRIDKGMHKAVERFNYFMRKVSRNGRIVKNGKYDGNSIEGYVLKADIKHYFETVDHKVLVGMLGRRIKDEGILWLVRKILANFESKTEGKGMPLGNYTSQFFANVYLNELDYFVKHFLKARYYIRYVDDFVILHKRKKLLEYYKLRINKYIKCLELELHPDKSKILPLRNGIAFLGYRIFYHNKRLRKRNIKTFMRQFNEKIKLCEKGVINKDILLRDLQGWFGYAQWADTYKMKKDMINRINETR